MRRSDQEFCVSGALTNGRIVQKSGHSNIRIGAVILAGLLIVASAILRVGGVAEMLVRRETLKAHFQRANGLQAGAPVILRGVAIGAVDSITFPNDPDASWVVVTMSSNDPPHSGCRLML